MPKQLYGKGPAKRRGEVKPQDDSIWLTVVANVAEDRLHQLIVDALSDPINSASIDEEMSTAFAASLIEYAAERGAYCDEAWIALIQEVAADFSISIAESTDEVESGPEAEREGACTLLRSLKKHRVLCTEPPPPPPLALGDAVLAVLAEDGAWHEALVVEKLAGGPGGPPRVVVRFSEWAKVQECPRRDVVSLQSVADDDDEKPCREGDCELCARSLELTFHHLIPKETHARYLGKALPSGVAEAAAANGLDPQPTREFLHSHGALLCRFCHSTVHRLAPNAVLAERFNTLEALRCAPEIERFVAFACRQKHTARRAL